MVYSHTKKLNQYLYHPVFRLSQNIWIIQEGLFTESVILIKIESTKLKPGSTNDSNRIYDVRENHQPLKTIFNLTI